MTNLPMEEEDEQRDIRSISEEKLAQLLEALLENGDEAADQNKPSTESEYEPNQ